MSESPRSFGRLLSRSPHALPLTPTLSPQAGRGSRSSFLQLALRDFVAREVFEDADQAGIVPALAAEGGGGVEQLLCRRGVGQGQAEGAGALQGEVQVL